jgi:hypothetical protein
LCTIIPTQHTTDHPWTAQAFADFENDPEAKVGVLWGEYGTFCAGADLKAFSSKDESIVPSLNADMNANGPMGISRMILTKVSVPLSLSPYPIRVLSLSYTSVLIMGT